MSVPLLMACNLSMREDSCTFASCETGASTTASWFLAGELYQVSLGSRRAVPCYLEYHPENFSEADMPQDHVKAVNSRPQHPSASTYETQHAGPNHGDGSASRDIGRATGATSSRLSMRRFVNEGWQERLAPRTWWDDTATQDFTREHAPVQGGLADRMWQAPRREQGTLGVSESHHDDRNTVQVPTRHAATGDLESYNVAPESAASAVHKSADSSGSKPSAQTLPRLPSVTWQMDQEAAGCESRQSAAHRDGNGPPRHLFAVQGSVPGTGRHAPPTSGTAACNSASLPSSPSLPSDSPPFVLAQGTGSSDDDSDLHVIRPYEVASRLQVSPSRAYSVPVEANEGAPFTALDATATARDRPSEAERLSGTQLGEHRAHASDSNKHSRDLSGHPNTERERAEEEGTATAKSWDAGHLENEVPDHVNRSMLTVRTSDAWASHDTLVGVRTSARSVRDIAEGAPTKPDMNRPIVGSPHIQMLESLDRMLSQPWAQLSASNSNVRIEGREAAAAGAETWCDVKKREAVRR